MTTRPPAILAGLISVAAPLLPEASPKAKQLNNALTTVGALKVRCLKAGPGAVAEAARVVKRGGVVAIPTDTVYGLGCDPSSDKAVGRLFEVKNRQAKAVPVLCASASVAGSLVDLDGVAKRLADAHWPGALTIVAPIKKGGGLSPLLDQGSGHLGVRVPDSKVCLALAGKVGGAITGTSANLSGSPSCRTAGQVVESLGGRVQLVIDGGRLRGKESTVVKVSGATVEVLREGSVRIQEGELKA
jgi:L-threonylcarbamoyladenylate synthase